MDDGSLGGSNGDSERIGDGVVGSEESDFEIIESDDVVFFVFMEVPPDTGKLLQFVFDDAQGEAVGVNHGDLHLLE